MSEINAENEAAVVEAKSSFDLKSRLQGRMLRTGSITIFTDEIAGEKHMAVSEELVRENHKAREAYIDKETGEVLIAAISLDKKRIAVLEKQQAALVKEIDATALSFEWRAVPEIVVKDARRRTHAIYDVNGSLPDGKELDFGDYFTAYLLSKAVTRFKDHESGTISTVLTIEDAQAMAEFLPAAEYLKLNMAFTKTQFTTAIAHEATDHADF